MALTLPDLPYPKNALEPHMSARTLEFHHGKHHKAYVDAVVGVVGATVVGVVALPAAFSYFTIWEGSTTL